MSHTKPSFFPSISKRIALNSRTRGYSLRVLNTDWSDTEQIVEELAGYVMAEQSKPRPIDDLVKVVEQAVAAYEKMLYHNNLQKHPDYKRVAAFLESLITGACEKLLTGSDDPEALYERICSTAIKTVLRRANYEPSMVFGRRHHCH